jgi:Ca2+-binding EF-hand superfamily protein
MNRLVFAIALCALSASVFGQQPPQQAGGPDAVFAAWDKDGNGALSKEEFRNGWANTRSALAEQRLRAEFQRHDANKSGKLEASEYANLMLVKRAGAKAPAMTAFDKNRNGGLEFEEYIDFIATAARQAAPAAAPKTK